MRSLSLSSPCPPECSSPPLAGSLALSLYYLEFPTSSPLAAACGGECACSTCHVILPSEFFNKLPEVSEEEEDMLDLAAGLTDTSRLACQVEVSAALEGMVVQLPEEVNNMMAE